MTKVLILILFFKGIQFAATFSPAYSTTRDGLTATKNFNEEEVQVTSSKSYTFRFTGTQIFDIGETVYEKLGHLFDIKPFFAPSLF